MIGCESLKSFEGNLNKMFVDEREGTYLVKKQVGSFQNFR